MRPSELVRVRAGIAGTRLALALCSLSASLCVPGLATGQVLIDETFDSSPCGGGWVCRGSAAWVPPLSQSNRCDVVGADPNNPFGDGPGDCTLYPDEGYVVLAPGAFSPGYQVGGIFEDQRRTYDDFKITAVVELRDGTRPDPADGMCIVIVGTQSPPGAGVWGGGMGATGLGSAPTLIVEFDTWGLNAGDSNDWNHVQLAWSPTGFPAVESIAISPAPFQGVKATIPQTWPLNNRQAPPASPNRFKVELYGRGGMMSLFLSNDDASTPLTRTRILTHEISGFTPFAGYVGATAATGGATQNHILHSIRVEELPQGFCLDPPAALRRSILGRLDPRFACGDFGTGDQLEVELILSSVRAPGASCGAPQVVTILETPPAGWQPFDITDGGIFNSGTGTITWTLSEGALASGYAVRYRVQPPGDAADVASWGGSIGEGSPPVDLFPTGGEDRLLKDTPFSECGGIRCWNMLGAFARRGGLSLSAIRQDYLTDGTVPEESFIWYPGARIDAAFGGDGESGSAATGLVGGTEGRNPAGVPEAFPWNDPDGFIDLDSEVFGGGPDSVMAYSQAYVINTTGSPMGVYLGVSSDDSVQVLLNGAEAWIRSIARAGSSDCAPQDVSPLQMLQPGTNSLIVKTFDLTFGWNFAVRFQDASGNPITSGLEVVKAPPGACIVPPATVERFVVTSEIAHVEGQVVTAWSPGVTYDVRLRLGDVRSPGFGCQGVSSVVVRERVPAGWTASNASDGGVISGDSITWNLPEALVQEGRLLTYTVRADGPRGAVRFAGSIEDASSISPYATAGVRVAHDPTGFSRECFIQDWLLLGPYRQPAGNGAMPGLAAMRRDHLTDGAETDEASVEPGDGDVVATFYGPLGPARSIGLEATANPDLNPGGVPTWHAWTDGDDTIDLAAVCGGNEDQVMFHALAYLDVEANMAVDIGLGSDDSVQVLLDGQEIWIHDVARSDGGANAVQDVIRAAVTPALNPLTAGRHRLLVKVFEGAGDHAFRLRLQDPATGEGICEGVSVCLDPGGCARDEFLRGDVNNDGWVSMGDAFYILDHTFLGGPGFTCREAANVNGDLQVDLSDAIVILNFLFLGGTLDGKQELACEISTSGQCTYPISPCDPFEGRRPEPTIRLDFDVARLVEEGAAQSSTEARVQLRNTDPDALEVRGWSLSIRVGPQPECQILAPTTDGTLGETADFNITKVAEGPEGQGIVSSIAISLGSLVTLPGNEIPQDLLRFRLQGTFVPGECSPCLLEFHDGLVGKAAMGQPPGRPVRNLVDMVTRDFQPFSRPAEVRFCSGATPLEPGGAPAAFSLPAASPTGLFKLAPAPEVGSVITIELAGADPDDRTALYARWGGAPSPVEFDHAADERGRASQRLVIPFARDRSCYVLVQGNVVAGESVEGVLSATESGIALERASADCGAEGCDGMIHVAIQGAGFDEMTSFFLERPPGLNLLGQEPTVVSAERAEVAFDLSSTSPGLYDLVARKGTGPASVTARLAGAVRVTRSRIGPRLEVSLEGPTYYREYQLRSLTLRYANTGDEEMPAPLFELRAFSTRPGTSPVLLGVAKDVGLRPWEFPDFTQAGAGGPEVAEGPLQVLGIHGPGIPGRLPAGASGEIPILFRHRDPFSNPPEPGERLEFFLRALDLGPAARLDLSSLAVPQGMTSGDWSDLRADLAETYGLDYRDALSEAASRLSKRGERPWRVKDLFRFAALAARREKTAVILGTARNPSLEPLGSWLVGALQGDEVLACALTDSEGAFALGPLENGTYRLAIEGYTSPAAEVTISDGEDEFLVVLQALGEKEEGSLVCPPKPPDDGLFPHPPGIPAAFLVPVAETVLKPAVSEDPNAKEGPDEELPVIPGQKVRYTLQFENCSATQDPNCSEVMAAARKIVLIDELSPHLDPATVKFAEIQMAEVEQLAPAALGGTSLASGYSWSTNSGRYDLSATLPVSLNYPAVLAPVFMLAQYEVSVVTTLERLAEVTYDLCGDKMDPALMDPEECALQEDLALVSEALKADPTAAHIIWVVRAGDPITSMDPRGYPEFELVGLVPPNHEPPMGEGLVSYDVDVRLTASDESDIVNKARIIFDTNPADPTKPVMHKVRVPFRRGDLDDNGAVDITDPINILNYLFSGGEAPDCLDAADANDDGNVNVSDPIWILNFLFAGLQPPRPPGPFTCGFDTTPDVESPSGLTRNLGCAFDSRRCSAAELSALAGGGGP